MSKSTNEEIRQRFDNDVERFSNLETGQSATIDAPIALDLVAKAATRTTPNAKRLLDVGCGAGNFSLRTLAEGAFTEVTLVDLSQNMIDRAVQRISAAHKVSIQSYQTDIREHELGTETFDVVVAGAVLHHLRDDQQWKDVFKRIYESLSPGGSFWIFDLVTSAMDAVKEIQQQRYAWYLTDMKDAAYQEAVFAYIEKEDSPVSLVYQLELLREVGFRNVDVLHFNTCFAAFGGQK